MFQLVQLFLLLTVEASSSISSPISPSSSSLNPTPPIKEQKKGLAFSHHNIPSVLHDDEIIHVQKRNGQREALNGTKVRGSESWFAEFFVTKPQKHTSYSVLWKCNKQKL